MKILASLILSVIFGLLIWAAAQSLLLPVTDASDGAGHGPDPGGKEWHYVINRRTENSRRLALYLGAGAGTVMLMVLSTAVRLKKK
jgi:hypothetical protein